MVAGVERSTLLNKKVNEIISKKTRNQELLWNYISKSDLLNPLYYIWQEHESFLYLHLVTCIVHNTFMRYKYSHFTINKYYVIIVI